MAERKILVALDGSEHASYAEQWAFSNLIRAGDHVELAFVAVPPSVPDVRF